MFSPAHRLPSWLMVTSRARPSLTARIVAGTRASVRRPHVPSGDPDGEDRLVRSLRVPLSRQLPGMAAYIAARTTFFDDLLLQACASGVRQVVIVGAGYDGRSVRFRQPGVRFFELDRPETQADKVARLRELGIEAGDVVFVPADLARRSAAEALASAGHDASQPTHFLCEGLTMYLPRDVLANLLGSLASRAAPGSAIALDFLDRDRTRGLFGRLKLDLVRLAVASLGERMVTLLTASQVESLLREAGWPAVECRASPPEFPVVLAAASRPAVTGPLNRDRLKQLLDEHGVSPDAYHLYGAHLSDRHVLNHSASGWSVFYSERGSEDGIRTFESESEACEYLFKVLLDRTTKER